jgi:hypothetical protein
LENVQKNTLPDVLHLVRRDERQPHQNAKVFVRKESVVFPI